MSGGDGGSEDALRPLNTLHDNGGKPGFLLQSHHPLREPESWAAPLQRDHCSPCVSTGDATSSDRRLFFPGSGLQTGTSLLQALSRVWGTSCLLIQEVSEEDWGQKGRCRSIDLGPPNLPGPQAPPPGGEHHHKPASGPLWSYRG